MKKLKMTLLVFYILIVIILIYEAAIPGKVSSAQHNFFKNIINNISKVFIKKKIIKPTDIIVNNNIKDSYYNNETLTLDISVKPDNSSYKTLSFSSSDESILTIDSSGFITFIKEGSASVKVVQEESKIEKIISFNVLEYVEPIEELIEPTSIILKSRDDITSAAIGDVIKFYLAYDKEGVNDHKFVLESSDTNVCKTCDDFIYGVGVGVSTITVTHKTTGLKSSMDIEITDGEIVKPTYYRLIGPTTIYVNDTTTHTYYVEVDPNASNCYKEVRFTTYDKFKKKTDPSQIEIGWNSGNLVFKTYGQFYVYAYIGPDLAYYLEVTIKNIFPDFNLENKRVILGDSYKININPINSDYTFDKYTFISTNEEIATVDGLGNITPKRQGEVEIVVEVNDGIDRLFKSFILTVDKKVIEDDIGSSFGKIIRKGIAHFLGFIVFGFVAFFMFYMWSQDYKENNKEFLIVVLVNGLVFAILTEVIQLISPGRDGTFTDVLLDYFGYMISFIISLLALLFAYYIKKSKKSKDKIESN